MCFLPWLITTSCLISEFQISGRISETLGLVFKLSAKDFDIRSRVCRLVFKSSAKVLGIRYPAEVFIKSGP